MNNFLPNWRDARSASVLFLVNHQVIRAMLVFCPTDARSASLQFGYAHRPSPQGTKKRAGKPALYRTRYGYAVLPEPPVTPVPAADDGPKGLGGGSAPAAAGDGAAVATEGAEAATKVRP